MTNQGGGLENRSSHPFELILLIQLIDIQMQHFRITIPSTLARIRPLLVHPQREYYRLLSMSATSSTTDPSAQTTASITPQSKTASSSLPKETLLPLPEPLTNSTAKTLDVTGASTTVKLDHLGPIVVNQDGTLSRIGNWDQMADIEKKNTLRILGKRNAARLAALRGKEDETAT